MSTRYFVICTLDGEEYRISGGSQQNGVLSGALLRKAKPHQKAKGGTIIVPGITAYRHGPHNWTLNGTCNNLDTSVREALIRTLNEYDGIPVF